MCLQQSLIPLFWILIFVVSNLQNLTPISSPHRPFHEDSPTGRAEAPLHLHCLLASPSNHRPGQTETSFESKLGPTPSPMIENSC